MTIKEPEQEASEEIEVKNLTINDMASITSSFTAEVGKLISDLSHCVLLLRPDTVVRTANENLLTDEMKKLMLGNLIRSLGHLRASCLITGLRLGVQGNFDGGEVVELLKLEESVALNGLGKDEDEPKKATGNCKGHA